MTGEARKMKVKPAQSVWPVGPEAGGTTKELKIIWMQCASRLVIDALLRDDTVCQSLQLLSVGVVRNS